MSKQINVLVLGRCLPSRSRGDAPARAVGVVHVHPAEGGRDRRRGELVVGGVAMQAGQTDAGAGADAGKDGAGQRVDDGAAGCARGRGRRRGRRRWTGRRDDQER